MNVNLGLTIDATGHTVEVSGGTSFGNTNLFTVGSGGSLTLTHLTLENGGVTAGSAAINVSGTGNLSINDSTFSGNFEAIYSTGTGKLSVTDSTFANNDGPGGGYGVIALTNTSSSLMVTGSTFSGTSGDAIDNSGTATIINSTITTTGIGGHAIYDSGSNLGGGVMSVTSSTISGNATGIDAANMYSALTVTGSIVADNSTANCSGTITDGGYNLEDSSMSSCGFAAADHDIVGQDPQLGSPAPNGGPTETMALGSNSPAIDYIPTSTNLCPSTDQRGDTRPDARESSCDIGAYESVSPQATLTVSNQGSGTGTVTSSPSGINCGSTCSSSFDQGTQVKLTASPSSGSTFAGWSGGGCSGTGTCQVTLNSDTAITATFNALPKETLTVDKAGGGSGTVTSSPSGIDCGSSCSAAFDQGTEVTLIAMAAKGSKFAGWSGGGCSGTGNCTVTMSSAVTVTATFKLVPPPNTTITKAVINGLQHQATFYFTGSGGTGALHFQCKLDSGSWQSCTSPKAYKNLTKGAHNFYVRAVDSLGRKDPTPATKSFTI
jgi:hypothetical protein